MNGPLQGYHLMQLLHSAWPIIRNDLCIREKTILKPRHGLAVFRMNLFFLYNVCLAPCLTYANRYIQSYICPGSIHMKAIESYREYLLSSLNDAAINLALSPVNPPTSSSLPPPSPSEPSRPPLEPALYSSAPSPSQPAHTLCFPRSSSEALHLALQQSGVPLLLLIFPVSSLSLRRSEVCYLKGLE